MLERANAYDKNGLIKREVGNALESLKEFRVKFPFAENPQSIDWLDPDKIFKPDSNEIGEFFRYLVYFLNPIGHLTIENANVYRISGCNSATSRVCSMSLWIKTSL